jgi:lysophospholipase L1-like esterase
MNEKTNWGILENNLLGKGLLGKGISGKGTKMLAMGLLGGGLQYWQKVKNLFGANLIFYAPLDEVSGTVGRDLSGNGRTSTYGGANMPVYASQSAPTGHMAPVYSLPGYILVPLSTLTGAEGGISFWINPTLASWTDGVTHKVLHWMVDANNYIQVNQVASALNISSKFGGVAKTVNPLLSTRSGWINVTLTWSITQDKIKGYYNSGLILEGTGIGTWVGSAATSYFGFSAPNNLLGAKADIFATNRYIEPGEVQKICDYTGAVKRLTVLGDSISGTAAGYSWATLVASGYAGASLGLCHHGAPGATILTDGDGDADMDAQTLAAAGDDADLIILELGTNDADTENIVAEYVENVLELKASNPRATIFGMGILDKTDVGARAANNTRLLAACATAGITFWNTDGWIVPATDTSDGTHPTAAGHAKIAAQVLARLP